MTREEFLALSPEEQQRIYTQKKPAASGGPSQLRALGSSLGQGLSFGFLDEMRGAMGGDIEKIRAEQDALREAYPKTYLGGEIAGAIAPMLIPGVGAAAAGTRAMGTGARLGRVALTSGGMGALDAAGRAEGGIADRAGPAAIGAGIGAVLGPIADVTLGSFIGRLSQKKGRTVGRAAEKEIRRIAELSQTSPDEIVRRIEAGEIMPEMNATLRAAAKDIVNRGGPAREVISDGIQTRVDDKLAKAQGAIQQGLYDGKEVPESALASWQRSDDQIKRELGGRYASAYAGAPEVPDRLARQFEESLRLDPALGREIGQTLSLTPGATPLFDDAGALVRKPRLQEVEQARAALRDKVDMAYRSGDNTRARALEAIEDNLRAGIDEFSPSLADTRAAYAAQSAENRAFKDSRKVIAKDPEEVAEQFGKWSPEEQAAGRVGMAQSLRTKLMRGKTPGPTIERLANPGNVEGANLLTYLSDEAIPQTQSAMEEATRALWAKRGIEPRSDTAQNIVGLTRQGTVGDTIIGGAVDAGTGNVAGLVTGLREGIKKSMGRDLTDAQMEEVARVMMSEDPGLVQAILGGSAPERELRMKVEAILRSMGNRAPVAGLFSIMEGME